MNFFFPQVCLGLSVMTILLSGCSGVIGAIIGERDVENIYGLDNRVIRFNLLTTESGLSTLQTLPDITVPITASFNTSTNDIDDLELPLGVAPKKVSEELGISPTVEMTSSSPESAFPPRLGIGEPSLDITFTDVSGAPSMQQAIASEPGTAFTFDKVSPCSVTDGKTLCQYQATLEEVFFFTLEFEGENLDTLFNDILQAGDPKNNVTATLLADVTLAIPETFSLPEDGEVKMTLKTRNGKVRFG
ncbi:MAG: hypothetical protein ACRCYY_03430 [Trueperaceae bacterium]